MSEEFVKARLAIIKCLTSASEAAEEAKVNSMILQLQTIVNKYKKKY